MVERVQWIDFRSSTGSSENRLNLFRAFPYSNAFPCAGLEYPFHFWILDSFVLSPSLFYASHSDLNPLSFNTAATPAILILFSPYRLYLVTMYPQLCGISIDVADQIHLQLCGELLFLLIPLWSQFLRFCFPCIFLWRVVSTTIKCFLAS